MAGPAAAQPFALCNVHITPGADSPRAFEVPPGGAVARTLLPRGEEECELRRADGTLYARAVQDGFFRPHLLEYFDAEGQTTVRYNVDYDGDDLTDGGGGGGGDRCAAATYSFPNVRWAFSPITWRWKKSSWPSSLQTDATLTSLRNAHIEWETNDDYCNIADNSGLNFSYSGTTGQGANNADGISTVDHGEITVLGLGFSSTARATEITRFSASTGQVVESDIRFDDDTLWTNNPASQPTRFDIWNVAAHEVGHRALFAHVADNRQVMAQGANAGQTIRRRLSRVMRPETTRSTSARSGAGKGRLASPVAPS